MNNLPSQTKQPYDFGRSIFLPFQSGPGSAGFVFKSAFFYSILTTVLIFLVGKMLMGTFVEFMQFAAEMENIPDDEAELEMVMKMFGIMGKMFLPIMLIAIGSWVLWSMVEAALFRRILRSKRDGFFPWRFGRDELRVMFCRLIVGLAGGAIFFLLYFVMAIVIIGAVAGGSQSGALGAIIGIIGFLAIMGAFGLFVFVIIRLSPASALSISEDRFALGEAWPVTKGRLWPIFGSYTVVSIAGMVISQIMQMVLMFAFLGGFLTMIPELEAMEDLQPDEAMAKIMEMITQPSVLVGAAIGVVLYYAFQTIWYMHFAGVSAHAVNLYNTDQADNSIDVFN